MAFQYVNSSAPIAPIDITPTSSFSLSASAPTDIWRKPPSTDVFTAPILYRSLPASSFHRARLTVTANWKTLYDQGGLIIILPAQKSGGKKRWIKTGIEFEGGKTLMSVVVADEWADWSLLPLSDADAAAGKVTVEIEREMKDGALGRVLKIHVIGEDGSRFMIREVTAAFHDTEDDGELWIGAFAAKPTKDENKALVVTFSGFEINGPN